MTPTERVKAWCEAHPERAAANKRAWYERNKAAQLAASQTPEAKARKAEYDRQRRAAKKEVIAEAKAAYAAANRTARSAYHRSWRAANRQKWNAYLNARRAKERTATPAWVDFSAIRSVYERAQAAGMHVDHIVPLQHPAVCGLHVPWNLQLLPPETNRRKSNKLIEEVCHAG